MVMLRRLKVRDIIEYASKFSSHVKQHGLRSGIKKSLDKMRVLLQSKRKFSTQGLGNVSPGTLFFRCNICGSPCRAMPRELQREEPSCPTCGSTVRMRAIVHVLSMELFGKSLAIQDFPLRKDITGVGMSDWYEYAMRLSDKLNYRNTYYHKEPKLDITAIDPALEGLMDFIISTDVFEHVGPPVHVSFENARKLLKDDGVFVFSVPYTKEGTTREHFPDLHKYEIIKKGDNFVLRNITKEGKEQIYDNLVFHGGDGATLEVRYFSESSLMEDLQKAGFHNVKFYKEPDFEHGIYWEIDCSFPVAARIK